jgi:Secretion system C-terminal sorting domain
MKKTLLAIAVVAAGFSATAQVDTLNGHFTGTRNLYVVGAANGGGYVSGNNGYGDLTKMVKFDNTSGTVTGSGQITGVLLEVPVIVDNGGSFQVIILGDNAGTPDITPLATATVAISSVDTTIAGYGVISPDDVYNVAVNFSTPAAVPSNGAFWVSVVLPTTTGDTIALVSNTDGDCANAATHVGELWSDLTFHTFGDPANWDLAVTLGIFPIVNFVASIDENVIEASVYPNPANDVLNITVGNEEIATVSIVSMDGKVVATSTNGTVNIADLTAGMYMYQVTTVAGKLANGNFAKK